MTTPDVTDPAWIARIRSGLANVRPQIPNIGVEMTNPTIATINPSKSKTWVAAVGGILTVIVPLLLQVATYLPDPWPAVIGGLIGLLTVLGVYKAPYKPEGTSVVSNADLKEVATPTLPVDPPPGGYENPWRG